MSTAIPTDVTERIGYRLKTIQNRFRQKMDAALRAMGISAPQYAVLSLAAQQPGISGAELARRAFVTAQSMQGIVANLERGGLLVRAPDPAHGRILKAEVSEAGQAKLREAHQRVIALERQLLRGVSADEARAFGRMLDRCAANLDSAH